MQVKINGMDITDKYHIQRATAFDSDGAEHDICEIAFSGKDAYSQITQVQEDDVLTASMDGYSTGISYVNASFGRDGDYNISARGMKSTGMNRRWASFENVTLMELMYIAAKEMDMGFTRYGLEDQKYSRIVRRNETWPQFLRRILKLESAVLKCVDGKLTAISIPWAQSQAAIRSYAIDAAMAGCTYKENYWRYRECILESTEVVGKAVDTGVPGSRKLIPNNIVPGEDKGQARRWAKGALLGANREASCVKMELPFDPEIAAMSRIDLTGMSVTKGKWLAGDIKHDLIMKQTTMILRPCIETIQ